MSYETVITYQAVPGAGGGFFGSQPQQSVVLDEPDYDHAAVRARIESLLPPVHDAQVLRGGQSIETWAGGQRIC